MVNHVGHLSGAVSPSPANTEGALSSVGRRDVILWVLSQWQLDRDAEQRVVCSRLRPSSTVREPAHRKRARENEEGESRKASVFLSSTEPQTVPVGWPGGGALTSSQQLSFSAGQPEQERRLGRSHIPLFEC